MSEHYKKLVIVGAPRSGTNMLRDAFCSLPGFVTWPCDEINPIWKHGHLLSHEGDDLSFGHVRPELTRFVRARFDRLAGRGVHTVVEKTCATSVRVAYVRALLPEAQYLFIHRHGADAVASAIQRWTSSVELSYTLRKVRYVPVIDLPIYGWRFVRNRVAQRLDVQRRMRSWGPMTPAVAAAASAGDVVRAAAWQWRDCVEFSLNQLPPDAVRLSYESFVANPVTQMHDLLGALDQSALADKGIESAVSGVRADLAGRGVQKLEKMGALEVVADIINPTLDRLGYARVG